jgi:ATP-binding cassette, subfamily B, bacterial MsbA
MALTIEEREIIERANKTEAKPKITRNGIGRLLSFVKPYWYLLAVALVAMLVNSVASLALPALAGSLIDTVFVKFDRDALNMAAIFLVGVFLVQAIAIFAQNYTLTFTGERVVIDLRQKLFRHLQTLSLSFFNDNKSGELISRLTNDVSTIQGAVSISLVGFIQAIVTLIGGITIIVTRDWRLTLLVLLIIPVLMAVGAFIGRKLRRLSNAYQSELGEATGLMSETIGNQKTVKAFTREEYEIGRFDGRLETAFGLARKRVQLQSIFVSIMTFLSFGAIVVVLWFGGQEVLNGRISPGELVSILIYMGLVAAPLGNLVSMYAEFQRAIGSAERIFKLLDEIPTVAELPNAPALPPVSGQLRFENVGFSYDDETQVLNSLSFEVQPGQVVALVGPSGAGKTTVANLIPRFFDPDSGRITVDGWDIRSVQIKSLREQIASVLQEPALFGVSIRENITYGRLNATDAEILEAARAANALEFIERLPDGLDTVVGERGVKLSGGQRQRIAIARAILSNPRILVLDEATSSLDNESESLVQEALDRIMQNRTTIVIAHRLTTVENAAKIVVIDRGQVVEEGTHAALMAKEGLYYRLYTRNFEDLNRSL